MTLRTLVILVVTLGLGAGLWCLFREPEGPTAPGPEASRTRSRTEPPRARAGDDPGSGETGPAIHTEPFAGAVAEAPEDGLRFEVVDERGRLVRDEALELERAAPGGAAAIWFWGQDPPPDPRVRGVAGSRVTTDAGGRFVLPPQGPPPGMRLVARTAEREGQVALDAELPVHRLVLRPFRLLEVRTVDEVGTPVAGIELRVTSPDDPRSRRYGGALATGWTTGPEGMLRVALRADAGGAFPGVVDVQEEHPTARAEPLRIEMPSEGVARGTLRIPRGVVLEVEVREGDRPAPPAWRLLGFGRVPSVFESFIESRSRTFHGARVAVAGLAPGQLTQLSLVEEGRPALSKTVRLPREPGRFLVTIERARPAARVRLRLRCEGAPVAERTVALTWTRTDLDVSPAPDLPITVHRRAITDADGRAEVDLPPGSPATLSFDPPRSEDPVWEDRSRTARVPLPALAPGEVREVDVELPPIRPLVSGRVVLQGVDDARRLVVRLGPEDTPPDEPWRGRVEARPDGEGRFRFAVRGTAPPALIVHAESLHGCSVPRRVRPGDTDVVLHLAPAGRLDVSFRLPEGVATQLRVGVSPEALAAEGSGPAQRARREQWKALEADGTASFTGLAQGRYRVRVQLVDVDVLTVAGVVVDDRDPSTDPRLRDRELPAGISPCRLHLRTEDGAPASEAWVIVPAAGSGVDLHRADASGEVVLWRAGPAPVVLFALSETHRTVRLETTEAEHAITLVPKAEAAISIRTPRPLPTNAVYDGWRFWLHRREPAPGGGQPTATAPIDLASGLARVPALDDGTWDVCLEPASSAGGASDDPVRMFLADGARHRLGQLVVGPADALAEAGFTVAPERLQDLLSGGF